MAGSTIILVAGVTCTEPGKEAEFARWYKTTHLDEMKRIPGVIDGAFYENMDPDKDSPSLLAIWALESEETVKVFKDHLRRQRKKEIPDFTWGPKFDIKWFKFFRRSAG